LRGLKIFELIQMGMGQLARFPKGRKDY